MSGGQQQMLSLGQAIVARPKFILADEMSLGLVPLIDDVEILQKAYLA